MFLNVRIESWKLNSDGPRRGAIVVADGVRSRVG